MEKTVTFRQAVRKIALPVTLQSLLQSSFSVVDQVMIGSLGKDSIAGIGLGGKFASLYSVLLAAIAAVAGILLAQYFGKQDARSAGRSFTWSSTFSLLLAAAFTALCLAFPKSIMGLYTKDAATKAFAAQYLQILALSFLPMAISSMLTTMLRCMEAAALGLYASVFALVLNTALNYLLIFGHLGFPALGVAGAAWASVLAQLVSCGIILLLFLRHYHNQAEKPLQLRGKGGSRAAYSRQYAAILFPILICEFLWSLGENVYAAIYGNMGTDASAAITMTVPVQTLLIGALSGLSQASAILIGKSLGRREYAQAYADAKKLMRCGAVGSAVLSVLLIALSPLYVRLYRVEPSLRSLTRYVLLAFAVIAPVKVQNMILGGGIIRSGGKTNYIMWVDIIGTWLFGVPLGLLSAFVWKLPIPWVYFLLSLEECVRFAVTLVIFRKKRWMVSL